MLQPAVYACLPAQDDDSGDLAAAAKVSKAPAAKTRAASEQRGSRRLPDGEKKAVTNKQEANGRRSETKRKEAVIEVAKQGRATRASRQQRAQ